MYILLFNSYVKFCANIAETSTKLAREILLCSPSSTTRVEVFLSVYSLSVRGGVAVLVV